MNVLAILLPLVILARVFRMAGFGFANAIAGIQEKFALTTLKEDALTDARIVLMLKK